MDIINWNNYDFNEFEIFCNALLTFELGKTYKPFSAPGPDYGIDGAFEGAYQDMDGQWRFQFKFYKTPRSQGVSTLKFQIKKEAAKLANEDFFALLTNIELLPQEQAELINIFENESIGLGKNCKCIVWDGAKIFNLALQFPLLLLWLEDGFTTAQLQDYKTVFKKNFSTQEFDPSSHANFFISRQEDLDILSDFIQSESSTILIIGEAGIGKTRLVIEFFKQRVDNMPDWTPLVLQNRNVDFDKIRKALSANRNYVILIDDAHSYKPEIIADMKVIVEGLNNNVKLILTSRTLEASKATTHLKEYDTAVLPIISLNELSRKDTEAIFRHYLDHTDYKHYTSELINTSFGKPILIIAMLNAIFNNTSINRIKEQDFLRNYVKKYFNTYYDKVVTDTGISRLAAQRLVSTVALIEPFNFNDNSIVNRLSELHGIEVPAVNMALKILYENGFVNGRYEQAIKPDYYSDILLSEISQSDVVSYMTAFVDVIDNIIINLSSVEEIDKANNNTVNDILLVYINLIRSSNNLQAISKVLETVRHITPVQLEIAKASIDIVIAQLLDNSSLMMEDYRINSHHNYQPINSPISIVTSILTNIYYYSNDMDFVYRSLLKLYNITREKKLITVIGFSKKDVIDKFPMTRQNYFLDKFSKKANTYNEYEIEFILTCCASFLNLDFTVSEWSAVQKDSLNIVTYYIPALPTVKKTRKAVIDLLISLYSLPNAEPIQSQILRNIIDVPRGIFATNRNNIRYSNDAEIKVVLEFIKANASDFNIMDQKEILDKLYWFEKWGISSTMLPLLEEVKLSLKPKNLVEQLSQLFSKAELSILEMKNIEQYIEEKCDEFVTANDEDELAEAIIAFLLPQTYPPTYYFSFQNRIENAYPEFAKKLHDKMLISAMPLYKTYGWRLLSSMYFKHNANIFYWETVRKLQRFDTPETDNVLLAVYSDKVPGRWALNKDDINVITTILDKKHPDSTYAISMALQSLFVVQHPLAMKYCKDFLDTAPQRQTDMFFIRLSDNTMVRPEQMEDLILNHTVRYNLTYEIEHCLSKIVKIASEEKIFDYLVKRFDYKKNITASKKTLAGYDFLPNGEYSRLFDDPEAKISMFYRALDWFIGLKDDALSIYFAKEMLEYLQPSKSLGVTMASHFKFLIKEHANKGEQLLRIFESLSIFENKDDSLIEIIIDAYDIVAEYRDTDLELYNDLRSSCYIAITAVGVKSGPANQPFQVDLDLKDLLVKYLGMQSEMNPVYQFLKEVLHSVESQINRSIDKDNFTW